ncbi:MAG TPA: hypothetical protein VGC99_11525 [Candidatus Tectomicrobia bacterium]
MLADHENSPPACEVSNVLWALVRQFNKLIDQTIPHADDFPQTIAITVVPPEAVPVEVYRSRDSPV